MRVAAVIVTRGDQDLTEILESHRAVPEIAFTYIWDNSREEHDLSVYGRYAAIERFTDRIVFVQDDDCVLERESFDTLFSAYQPGVLTANMPQQFRHDFYRDHCLVGFGAIFDRDLPEWAFRKFQTQHGYLEPGMGPWFRRTCDVVFTTLVTRHLVDVPYRNLPWASNPERMWKQPHHVSERKYTLDLARQSL